MEPIEIFVLIFIFIVVGLSIGKYDYENKK